MGNYLRRVELEHLKQKEPKGCLFDRVPVKLRSSNGSMSKSHEECRRPFFSNNVILSLFSFG